MALPEVRAEPSAGAAVIGNRSYQVGGDMMLFTRATKRQARARIALAGPSGSGKTFTALTLATHLGAGRIALLDTEHGSASKYADRFDFDVLDLAAPFHPDRFAEAIKAAADAGYGVLVIDSLSHAWNGKGGLLEIVDQFAARMKSSNTFAAWKDATPIQARMVEALLSAPLHVIATMRSKQEYVIEQVERNGRTTSQPRKVGMAPIQRDQIEYEFDIFAEMDVENNFIVSKTRCPELAGAVVNRPGKELADTIRAWLDTGAPALAPSAVVEPEYEHVAGELIQTATGAVVEDVDKKPASVKDVGRLRAVLLELAEPSTETRLNTVDRAATKKAYKLTTKEGATEVDVGVARAQMVALLARTLFPGDFVKQEEIIQDMELELEAD